MQSSLDYTSREAGADDVNLEEIFEQELLSGQAEDTEDVTEETLLSAPQLIQAVDQVVHFSKKSYEGLIRILSSDLQAVR